MTAGEELKLSADLVLSSRELRTLVEQQQAGVGYFVVCRRTYFNVLQEAPLGKSEKFFDATRLFGAVTLPVANEALAHAPLGYWGPGASPQHPSMRGPD